MDTVRGRINRLVLEASDIVVNNRYSMPVVLRTIEDGIIRAALDSVSGNKASASRILGVNRTALFYKIERMNRGKKK